MPKVTRSNRRSAARSTNRNVSSAVTRANKVVFAAAMLCSATLATSEDAILRNYLNEAVSAHPSKHHPPLASALGNSGDWHDSSHDLWQYYEHGEGDHHDFHHSEDYHQPYAHDHDWHHEDEDEESHHHLHVARPEPVYYYGPIPDDHHHIVLPDRDFTYTPKGEYMQTAPQSEADFKAAHPDYKPPKPVEDEHYLNDMDADNLHLRYHPFYHHPYTPHAYHDTDHGYHHSDVHHDSADYYDTHGYADHEALFDHSHHDDHDSRYYTHH